MSPAAPDLPNGGPPEPDPRVPRVLCWALAAGVVVLAGAFVIVFLAAADLFGGIGGEEITVAVVAALLGLGLAAGAVSLGRRLARLDPVGWRVGWLTVLPVAALHAWLAVELDPDAAGWWLALHAPLPLYLVLLAWMGRHRRVFRAREREGDAPGTVTGERAADG